MTPHLPRGPDPLGSQGDVQASLPCHGGRLAPEGI